MSRVFFLIVVFLGSADLALSSNAGTDAAPKEKGMLDRILHPDTKSKSPYNDKIYHPLGSVKMNELNTKVYSGTKEFGSKSFATKSFDGIKKNWLGRFIFPDKNIKDYQVKSLGGPKSFPTKEVATGSYSGLDKKTSYSARDSYATRNYTPKGATQGAIDNNEKLQQAVKKGLTMDEVRNLLNKAP